MADDQQINQDEIEQMLNQASDDVAPDAPAKPDAAAASPEPLDQSEIESLLGGSGATKGAGEAETASSEPSAEASAEAAADSAAAAVTDALSDKPAEVEPSEDDDKLLGQDEIEKLLNQTGTTQAEPPPDKKPQKEPPPEVAAGQGAIPQEDVEFLLSKAEQALASIDANTTDEMPEGVTAFRLDQLPGAPASTENATLDLIRDVELDLKIELGRTHMYLEDVLKLSKGSVVPLDKLAGDPVDIYVNGRLIARGEVLVLNDNFCVRVAELITGSNVFA